jgi:hypothetical protein
MDQSDYIQCEIERMVNTMEYLMKIINNTMTKCYAQCKNNFTIKRFTNIARVGGIIGSLYCL